LRSLYSLHIQFVKLIIVARRTYRLGKRGAQVDRTRELILRAAQDELITGTLSVGGVARRAEVTRITVYNHFGSKAGLLQALDAQVRPLGPLPSPDAAARDQLQQRLATACSTWASNASLFRHLPRTGQDDESGQNRQLAERLAASDELRPGCSIKEAEDVIGALTSFEVFDRLSKDGRRSPAAVAEILGRLASGILAR
jgi:AcrR family transcriptional regulator